MYSMDWYLGDVLNGLVARRCTHCTGERCTQSAAGRLCMDAIVMAQW